MKRIDCLELLDRTIDDNVITVTSLSGNQLEWAHVRKRGANFTGLNMGMCTGFAAGVALALPRHRVVGLESDGSLLLDTSVLVTLAQAPPPNLLLIVFDNERYGRMLPTPTATGTDLAAIVSAAGLPPPVVTSTVEEFARALKDALARQRLSVIIAKVEPGTGPWPEELRREYRRDDGRPMKERFVQELRRLRQ